jgi:hypothetical protein
MPRKLRFEQEGAVYHVLNRGNYRAEVFGAEGAKTAFLQCLDETCAKTGWMSKGWIVGSNDFKVAMALEHRNAAAALARGDRDAQEAREGLRQALLDQLLREAKRTRKELGRSAKMADWKVALAAAMKAKTTVTNRWLAEELHMGSLHEVSRRVAASLRKTTNYKT